MVIHNRTVHPELKCMPGDPTFNFRMERMGLFKTPLERQVNEAIRIKNSKADLRMNSGSEWRSDAIPRTTYSAPGLENRKINYNKLTEEGGIKDERDLGGRRKRPGLLRLSTPITLDIIDDLP